MEKIENSKELIISYCKECLKSDEEAEEIYQKFSTDKKLLDEFVYYIKNRKFPSAGVIIREYTYSTLQFYDKEFLELNNPLEAYLYMLNFRQDPEKSMSDYAKKEKAYWEKIYEEKEKFDMSILKIMHSIVKSDVLVDPYTTGVYTRDYACENLHCPSEQYMTSDWETTLRIDKDFEKFVEDRQAIIFRNGYHVTGYVEGKLVDIIIKEVK